MVKKPPVAPPAVAGSLKVGLLLPLSGANAELGQSLLNASQMALFDDKAAQIELLPRDSGDDPASATNAFAALAEQNVALVIGPLFAPQVAAVRAPAAQRGIPLLGLSNDTSVANGGTYVLGFSPAAQIMRVTDYACAQGSKRFVALLPTGGYGDTVNSALQKAVRACPGAALAMRRYDSGTDQLARQLQETAQARQQLDTLVLAESPANLQSVPFPQVLDGAHVRLLGTGLWADETAVKQVPALVGGWYAIPDGGNRQRFVESYQAAYGAAPPRLAGLTYDAVALAAALQKRGQKADRAALTAPNGFMGIDGVFRLLPNGTVERGLAIKQIGSTGTQQLDPAPAGFVAATN